MLIDTGPIVALLNRRDPHHASCVAAAMILRQQPLITTWPCLTEMMYLLHRAGGHAAQDLLWGMITAENWKCLSLSRVISS